MQIVRAARRLGREDMRAALHRRNARTATKRFVFVAKKWFRFLGQVA